MKEEEKRETDPEQQHNEISQIFVKTCTSVRLGKASESLPYFVIGGVKLDFWKKYEGKLRRMQVCNTIPTVMF